MVDIHAGKQRSVPVRGVKNGPLIVHPSIDAQGFWTLSHASTGLFVVHCRTEEDCKRIAEVLLKECPDWNGTQTQVVKRIPQEIFAWIRECRKSSSFVER